MVITKAGGSRQEAKGKRQKAKGKRQKASAVSSAERQKAALFSHLPTPHTPHPTPH